MRPSNNPIYLVISLAVNCEHLRNPQYSACMFAVHTVVPRYDGVAHQGQAATITSLLVGISVDTGGVSSEAHTIIPSKMGRKNKKFLPPDPSPEKAMESVLRQITR